jgi:hypothetical protein
MTRLRQTLRAVAAVVVAVSATACSKSTKGEDTAANHPATVERIAGSEGAKVTLTADAVKRIGLDTAVVTDAPAGGGAAQRSVADAALLYDPSGRTWTYVQIAPRSYVRTSVTVVRVVGDQALISDGPPSGAAVVTTGAEELYGAESTFGED